MVANPQPNHGHWQAASEIDILSRSPPSSTRGHDCPEESHLQSPCVIQHSHHRLRRFHRKGRGRVGGRAGGAHVCGYSGIPIDGAKSVDRGLPAPLSSQPKVASLATKAEQESVEPLQEACG